MCTVCGCSDAVTVDGRRAGQGKAQDRWQVIGRGHGHETSHSETAHHHCVDEPHPHDHHHYGEGPAGASAPGMSQARLIEVETAIHARNDALAQSNRRVLNALGVLAVNLVSAPGAGKTALLCKTIQALGDAPLAVVEGDPQTSMDADRIRATGARAFQINTGKGCHLDAQMVGDAIDELRPRTASYLFIENVGNLVCPAAFDLGEDARVAMLSVTEGEDKPLKYPDIFATAKLVILSKIDLAPHTDADIAAYEANLRRVNPAIEILKLSARTGEGMEAWLHWLKSRLEEKAA
jgi:hydrogenase nickel incorporation protein HypB